jgi:hypothetical protein
MAPKSMEIPHNDLKSAFATLTRMGLKAGADATVALDGTVTLLPGACDRLVEVYIHSREVGAESPPVEPPAKPQPLRRDRRVLLPQWAELKLLDRHRAFIVAMAEDAAYIESLHQEFKDYRRRLRLNVIHDYAQGDVVTGNTYCYGGQLEGATTLETPTGEIIRCDRLIHYTHPVNPEDLYLREVNVWCNEICRYYVPGLDDGEWNAQNEPLQAITPESYRELLLARSVI